MYQLYDSYNSHLTNLAQGLWLYPGKEVDLTRVFFPVVGVETTTGTFDKYATAPALTAVDTRLARDNSPRRIQQDRTEGTWNCRPNALEIAVFGPALLQKGHAAQLRESHTRTLVSAMFASRQVAAVDAVKTAVTPTSTLGTWGADTDVIDQIDELCKAVVSGCGKKPNKLVIGHSTWKRLRNHAALRDRLTGITLGLKPEDLADVLTYKGLDIIIADSMAMVGRTMTELLANDIIALHNEDTPSLEDLSFGKEFSLTPAGPEVLTYKEHGGTNEVNVLMWSSDCKVVNSGACARMEVTEAEPTTSDDSSTAAA